MDKKNVENLRINPDVLRRFKRVFAGALALTAFFPVVGCRNEKNNGGDYGIENSPSSFSDSHDKSSSEKEASSSRKDSSSRESSHINSKKDGDYVLEDDGLDHHPDITPDDYIAVVTDGPIVSTDERISTTTTVKGGRASSSSSSVDNSNEKNNSGTSTRRGGGSVGIASVDDGKNNKIPRESTPVNTTARVKVTTTAPVTTTTTAPVTTTTPEPAPIVTDPDNQIADVTYNNYNINDICYNADAFESYVYDLSNELRTNCDGTIYDSVDGSSMREQACAFMSLINYGNVSSDVLQKVYNDFGFDDFNQNVSILINYNSHLDLMHYKIDFTKYACDSCKHVGESLNEYQDAYERQDGSINDLIRSNFIDGKPCDDLKNQPARFFFMMNLSRSLFFDYYNFDNDYFTTVGLYSDYYNQFVDGMSHSK